jgi:phycobilisome rod-core linker protein
MTLPLLSYSVSSQNQRVKNFEVPGDEQPRGGALEGLLTGAEVDAVIQAAYRQIFNEQQMIAAHRQVTLESQLRSGHITVRDFIRGLLLSDSFRRLVYDANSNYRVAELCVQRVLGRSVYSQREPLAWSIVLATKGLPGFVEALLGSDEYLNQFGDGCVPYQRRRILPQRAEGELPFARMARYDGHHLDQLLRSGQLRSQQLRSPMANVVDRSAPVYRRAILLVPAFSLALLSATLILVAAPK